ncbi:MAG: RnfABCDGE type electron transport complex subunit D [Clostridia bacterium]|nr:RnfABCDGE type electron transport complex subunit D [Clostridia bacterium]
MNIKNTAKIEYNGKTLDTLIALCPAGLAGIYFFGLRALMLIATCAAACILFEYLWNTFVLKTAGASLESVVTGLVLAYSLPPKTPVWLALIGSFVAIILIKCMYEKPFVNPAFAGKAFIAAAFGGYAGAFLSPSILGLDSIPTPTPLMGIKYGSATTVPNLLDVFMGNAAGSIGQACALLILVGGVYLILKKVISWIIPVCFIGTLAVITFAFAPDKNILSMLAFAGCNVLSGGALFGAVFALADKDMCPTTTIGKIISGVFAGIITACIRLFGLFPDGSVHAILLTNILNPVIDKLTLPMPEEIT